MVIDPIDDPVMMGALQRMRARQAKRKRIADSLWPMWCKRIALWFTGF